MGLVLEYLELKCQELFCAGDKRAAHSWRVVAAKLISILFLQCRAEDAGWRWQGARWPPSPGDQRRRPLIVARCKSRPLLGPIILWQRRSGQIKISQLSSNVGAHWTISGELCNKHIHCSKFFSNPWLRKISIPSLWFFLACILYKITKPLSRSRCFKRSTFLFARSARSILSFYDSFTDSSSTKTSEIVQGSLQYILHKV